LSLRFRRSPAWPEYRHLVVDAELGTLSLDFLKRVETMILKVIYRLKIFCCLAIGFIVFSFFTGCRQEPIVARVGDESISLREFQYYLLSKVGDVSAYSTPEQLHQFLQTYIDRKLKLMDAYESGLDEDGRMAARFDDYKRSAVLNYTLEKEVYEKAIPDSLVRSYYERLRYLVKLKQLFMPLDNKTTDSVHCRAVFDSLYQRVLAGQDLAGVHAEAADNRVTVAETGYLYWGSEGYGDDFYREIGALQRGKISAPIKSKRGWHLVQVLDKRSAYILTFAEVKSVLRYALIRFYERQMLAHYDRFLENLDNRYQIVFNDSNIAYVIEKIHAIRQIDATQVIGPQTAQSLTEEELARELFQFINMIYRISDFLAEKGIRHPAGIPFYDSVESLKQHIIELLPDEERIIEYGLEHNYDKTENVQLACDELLKQGMIEEIERLNVHSRLMKPTRKNLVAYYNENKSKYQDPGDPGEIREFKNVRSKVVLDFEQSQLDSLQQKWLRRLKDTYVVKIEKDVLEMMQL
jgi:hypothetical protein